MRAIALLPFLCLAGAALAEPAALAAAARAAPQVRWDAASAHRMDIDCDGKPDYALLGRAGGKVYVGIVRGPLEGARAHVFTFGVGQSQESVCEPTAKLRPESLDYDPKEAVGELPGFRRSKRCTAVALADEACDAFHFYWNHGTGRPDWWRM